MQQHSTQPYQGQAPARQVQQSPNLSNAPSNQQSFAAQNPYTHHTNIQSPYLNHSNHFPPQQQQHQNAQENSYYASHPSPRSSNSATYYPAGKLWCQRICRATQSNIRREARTHGGGSDYAATSISSNVSYTTVKFSCICNITTNS